MFAVYTYLHGEHVREVGTREPKSKILGQMLKRLRKELTQNKVVEALNAACGQDVCSDDRYLRKVEAGERHFRRWVLLVLATKVYGVKEIPSINHILYLAGKDDLREQEIKELDLNKSVARPRRLIRGPGFYELPQGFLAPQPPAARAWEDYCIFQTLSVIAEGSPFAICVFDVGGCVRVWNPVAKYTYGWSKDEVKHLVLPPFIPDEQIEDFELGLIKATATGDMGFLDILWRFDKTHKNGSLLNMNTETAILSFGNGYLAGFLNIASVDRDVRLDGQCCKALRFWYQYREHVLPDVFTNVPESP